MSKSYIICDDHRVKNSPFFIEGSNVPFDIVSEFPIPTETDAFDEAGNPIRIRFVMGCNTIIKEEQVRRGWPENRRPTDTERELLTFRAGMLTVPDGYPFLEQYLSTAPWFKTKDEVEDPSFRARRPFGSRVIYQSYDQDQLDDEALDFEAMVTEARNYIQRGSREELVNLYRLAKPGGTVNPQIDAKTIKLELLKMAQQTPEFILKGIKGAREELVVVVSKALDYGILSLDTIGKLMMKKNKKWTAVASVPDVGGRMQKTERVVALFEQTDYKPLLTDVKNSIQVFEQNGGVKEEAPEVAAAQPA